MNVNSSNNINFQAKLNVSRVGVNNKGRWQEIAKMVAEKTPKDHREINVQRLNKDILISTPFISLITNRIDDLFKKYDNSAIVDKIQKLLKIATAVELKKDMLTREYQDLADKKSWINSDVFYNKLNEKIQKVNDVTMKHLEKDEFWNNFEIIL